MPESTCLHIQGRESGPIRVVELPWISVRIGRAAFCEVQLPEYDVADEACRLQRRGRFWHLVPVTLRSPVLVEGRPIDGPFQLSFDVPFSIGAYCLTLRRDRAAEPDWEMYQGPAPRQLNQPAPMLVAQFSANAIPERASIGGGSRPTAEPENPPAAVANLTKLKREGSQGPTVKDRWEARWRAAGAELKARAERTKPGGDAKRPDYGTRYDSVPLKEPRVARAQPAAASKVDATIRPTTAATVAKIAPTSISSVLEPIISPSPAQDLPTSEIAPDRPVDAPTPHPFEAGDFENRLELALSGAVADEPPPSTAANPVLDASTVEDTPEDTPVVEADQVQAGEEFRRITEPDRETELTVPATEPEPIVSRPKSRKRKGASAGARLIGKSPQRDGSTSHDQADWPSVEEILATHRIRPNPPATPRTPVKARRSTTAQTVPTLACEPNQWTLPLWLVWPPVTVLVLCVGMVGCVLSWTWGGDSYSASIMTNRLILADAAARRTSLPQSVAPPRGTWIETSAQHLAHWAIYLNRFERQKDDPGQAIRDLLERALQVSPINPTAKLALAQLESSTSETAVSNHGLGLSRDPLSLAWSGRRLLEARKKEAALNLYRQALAVEARGEFSQVAPPRFNDDQGVPRYLLPGEERFRDMIRELVARNEWTAGEWLEVLPRKTLAILATARLLREQARHDVADALLDVILNQPRPLAIDGPIEPLMLAVRAEAFALRSRWEEADKAYSEAIELLDDVTLKRAWWFNLADIALRLADDAKREAALRATLTVAASDDISRRATEILRASHAPVIPRTSGAKAN